jgi:hypothetical protein
VREVGLVLEAHHAAGPVISHVRMRILEGDQNDSTSPRLR